MRVELDLFLLRKGGVFGAEAGGVVLVFLPRKGAGRIDERAAGREHTGGAVEDLRLAVRTHADFLLAPFGRGRLFLAQHPLPRTGRVHEDLIKISRKAGRERGGVGAGHDGVYDPHALDVLQEDTRAVGHLLVEDEDPLPAHRLRELRALPARRAAKVEHPLARAHPQRGAAHMALGSCT